MTQFGELSAYGAPFHLTTTRATVTTTLELLVKLESQNHVFGLPVQGAPLIGAPLNGTGLGDVECVTDAGTLVVVDVVLLVVEIVVVRLVVDCDVTPVVVDSDVVDP